MDGLLEPELETDITTLLECLQCQSTSESLKKTLMTLASILMSTECSRNYFRQCHGLEVVNTLLRKTRDPVVVQSCLFCLATAAERTVATQRVLGQMGTFKFLHKLLENADLSTAKMVAYYINSLVLNNGSGQQMSFTSGCLSRLIDLLRSYLSQPHPEDVQLFLPILTTAIGACVNNPQNEKNQSQCSVLIPHCLRHVAQSSDLDLVNRLLALLGFVVESNLSMQERLRQCGGMEVLLARLKQSLQVDSSSAQLEIRVALVSTLNFAFTSNGDNVDHFVKGGGLEALCKLLEDTHLDQGQQLAVVVALATVLELSVEGREWLSHSQDQGVLVHLLMETQAEDLVKSLKYIIFMCSQGGSMDGHAVVSEVEAAKTEINIVTGLIEKLKGLQDNQPEPVAQPDVPALPAGNSVQVPAMSFSTFLQSYLPSMKHLQEAQHSHPPAALAEPSSSTSVSTAIRDVAIAQSFKGANPAGTDVQMPGAFSSTSLSQVPSPTLHLQGAQPSHLPVVAKTISSNLAIHTLQNQQDGAPQEGEASNFHHYRPTMSSYELQGNLALPLFSRNPEGIQQSHSLLGAGPSASTSALPVYKSPAAQFLQGGASLEREPSNFRQMGPTMTSLEQQGNVVHTPCSTCSGGSRLSHPSSEVMQASPFPATAPVPVSREILHSHNGAPWAQATSNPQLQRPKVPSCTQQRNSPLPQSAPSPIPRGMAVNLSRSRSHFQPIHPATKETLYSGTQVPPVQPQFRVPQPLQQPSRSSAFSRPSPVVQARLDRLFQSSPSPAGHYAKQSHLTPRQSTSDEMVGNQEKYTSSNQVHSGVTAQHNPRQQSAGEQSGHKGASKTLTRKCSQDDIQLKATHQEIPCSLQSLSLNPQTPTSYFSQQLRSGQAWGEGNQNNSAVVPAHNGAGSASVTASDGQRARQLQATDLSDCRSHLHAGARQTAGCHPARSEDLAHTSKVVSPQSRKPASSFAMGRLCDIDEFVGEVPPTLDYTSQGRHPCSLPTRPDKGLRSSFEEQLTVPQRGQKFSDSSQILDTPTPTRFLTSSYETSAPHFSKAADSALGKYGKQQSISYEFQTEVFKAPKQLAPGNKLTTTHAGSDSTFAKPQNSPRCRKSEDRSHTGTPCKQALRKVPRRAASSEARVSAQMEVNVSPTSSCREVSSTAEWNAKDRKTSTDKRDASPKSDTSSADKDGKVRQDPRSEKGQKKKRKASTVVISSPAKSESHYNLRSLTASAQPDKFSAKELDGGRRPLSTTVLETDRNATKSTKKSQSARKSPKQSRQAGSESGSAAARLDPSPYDFSDSDNSLSSTEDQFPCSPVSLCISSPGSVGNLSSRGPRKNTSKCPGCSRGGGLNSRTYNLALETCTFTCSSHRTVRLQERRFIRACHKHRILSCPSSSVQGSPGKKHGAEGRHKAGRKVAKPGKLGAENERNKAESMAPPAPSRPRRAASAVMGRSQSVPGSAQRRPRVPYSTEELDNLQAGVARFGHRWGQILATYAFHPSRTAIDLMEKCKRLKQQHGSRASTPAVPSPSASHPSCPLSLCEERRLRRGVQNFGYSWTTILHAYSFAHGRRAEDLRQHWRQMNKRKLASHH